MQFGSLEAPSMGFQILNIGPNWLPPLTYPPKMEPPRAKYIGEGNNLLGKRINLNEYEQITLNTKEITTNSVRNKRDFVHA